MLLTRNRCGRFVSFTCTLTAVIGAVIALGATRTAAADDPPGCSGVGNSAAANLLSLYTDVGNTSVSEPVLPGTLILFQAQLINATPVTCNYCGGQLSITFPNATVPPSPPTGQNVHVAGFGGATPAVPCVGFASPFQINSPFLYTVNLNHVVLSGGSPVLRARLDYGATEAFPGQVDGTFQDRGRSHASQSSALALTLAVPAIRVVKSADPPNFCIGVPTDVTYTYMVSVPPFSATPGTPPTFMGGNVPLSSIMVQDDHCGPVDQVFDPMHPGFNIGDLNQDHVLDLNETWKYRCVAHGLTSSVTNTAMASGTYSIRTNSQTVTATHTITVNATKRPICTVTPPTAGGCMSGPQTFTCNPSGGTPPYRFSWLGPGGFTSTAQSITVSAAGMYCCVVTDHDGKGTCSSQPCCAQLGSGGGLGCEVLPQLARICEGSSQVFTANGIGGTPPYHFAWTSSNGFTATTQMISVSQEGAYCVMVTDNGGCSTITPCCGFLKVRPRPVLTVTPQTATICAGQMQAFHASAHFGTQSYMIQWRNSNGDLLVTCQNLLGGEDCPLMASEPGQYCARVIDANGCTDEKCVMLNLVNDCCRLKVDLQGCVVPPPPPSGGTQCVGKVLSMTLRYTGQECSASHNTQAAGKVGCSGTINMASPVRIVASSNTTLSAALAGAKYFDGIVNVNGLFVASAANAGVSQVATNTYVYLLNPQTNALLMSVNFHTSCSQPMNVGDQYGTLLLHSLTSTNGGTVTLPPGDGGGECITRLPPPPTGQSCVGKVIKMTMKYTGDDCTATHNTQAAGKVTCTGSPNFASPVRIRASDGSTPTSGNVWFDGNVNLNGTFVINAANAGQSQIANTTYIYVFNPSNTVVQTISIHTSCSQPLNPGDQFGSALLIGLQTTNGGTVGLGSPVKYTYTVSNNVGGLPLVNVRVVDDTFGEVPGSPIPTLNPGQTVVLMQTVNVSDSLTNTVTVCGDFAGNQMPDPCFCTASDSTTITQNPIPPVPIECCEHGKPRSITMRYTGDNCSATHNTQAAGKVACSGDPAHAQLVTIKSTDNANPNASGVHVWFNGQVALNATFALDANNAGQSTLGTNTWIFVYNAAGTTLLQTIQFHTSCSQPLFYGDQFGSALLVNCTGVNEPNPLTFCTGGVKPKALSMLYDGRDCSASHHTQAAGKVSCSGDPQLMPLVHIRASNSSNPSDLSAKVWFDGMVMILDQFSINAANANQTRLGTDTWVHIWDPSGTLLQTIKFHTSCSQPLNMGDQFGSLRLMGFTPE